MLFGCMGISKVASHLLVMPWNITPEVVAERLRSL